MGTINQKINRLQDKVVIITGGGQGIGHAYALGFAREGAKVVVADVNWEGAQRTAAELDAMKAEALAIKTDVSSVEETKDMARRAAERFGRIDILVNNAALCSVVTRGVPFDELDIKEWQRTLDVNVNGTFFCCRAVSPYMKQQRYGRIINVTSGQIYSGGGRIKYIHYVTSKAAIVGLNRALARELGEYNITVNCLAPGGIFSGDRTNKEGVAKRKRIIDLQCIERMGFPEDVVGTAIFLASSDSDFVTGQTIPVDGGHRMV